MRQRARGVLVVALVVAGCGSSSSSPPPRPGADCRLVAQAITSLEMGNYAEPEVREPREREIERMCTSANLTKTDAECLLSSPALDDLAYCPTPLVVKPVAQVTLPPVAAGDICEQYVRRLERITRCATFPPDSARALRGQIPQLRQMYAQYGSQKQVQQSCKMALDATDRAYAQLGC
ncbi:MAG: hypothetical protein AB7T06_41385 [Kofleriaceae bacterium]